MIRTYNNYRTDREDPINYDWSNVTPDDFNEFRIRGYQIYKRSSTPERMKDPKTPSTSKPSNSVSYSKAEIFKKGIKRDPYLFRDFKDNKQFKSWHRHLLTTAGTQDVKEVLDPQYTPQTEEDADLFQLKQEYMYNVADNILQTDRGIV